MLDHGNIVEQGSHDELIDREGLYAEMYHREIEQAEEVNEREVNEHENNAREVAQWKEE